MLVEHRRFKPTPLPFGTQLGVIPLEFRRVFGIRKLVFLVYRIRMALFV